MLWLACVRQAEDKDVSLGDTRPSLWPVFPDRVCVCVCVRQYKHAQLGYKQTNKQSNTQIAAMNHWD